MLDKNELKTIANESPTSQAVFDHLASRQRFRVRTNLVKLKYDLIHNGKKVVDNEYLGTFKKLHELGVGNLIVGRRGKPNRFIWNFNLKDIGQAAFNELKDDVRTVGKKSTKRRMRVRKKIVEQQNVSPEFRSEQKLAEISIPIYSHFKAHDITALLDLIKELSK
jgi:hypothetical protein